MNANASLGKASLWSAISGIILPVCLAAIVAAFPQRLEEKALAFGICGFLFVVLEFVAHGCGIAARRTATGKAGLVISGVLLPVGSLLIWGFLFGI